MLNTCLNSLKRDILQGMKLCSLLRYNVASVIMNNRVPQHSQQLLNHLSSAANHQFAASSYQSLYNHQQVRNKSKKSGKRESRNEEDLDDDEPEHAYEDIVSDKYNRTTKVVVTSMRADVLLKAGLDIARNKVDTLFYGSKIRLNGKKLTKKSTTVDVDDEIDVVRGPSPSNPNHLIVSRVEILSVTPRAENIAVVIQRNKSLTIENYSDGAYDGDQEK
ncbi:mitochondrial transcription rescue factor 1 [Anopheles ziemanni]|uniref:mitochondrial transcription rescue factor 1 n=1 Tax=Anopheles coustani TaxID=139045 RepID=UPI00265A5251|nr:mitochondrial transcription rescue factor 1 [Anopheles coustani]XP_058174907.1 mitochondrial transcription rescue factor 1 [Anopheles ziemanni]